jgi:hypothetical protein
MAYQILDPQDLVLSADSTVTPLWSNFQNELSTFFTSSIQSESLQRNFYLTVYNNNPDDENVINEEIQFSIAYGSLSGFDGSPFNVLVPSFTPTRVIYGQYRSLLLGDEEALFNFGGYESSEILVLNIERARFKEKLFPASFELSLSTENLTFLNSVGGPIDPTNDFSRSTITLISDAKYNPPTFTNAGRMYYIISGSIENGIYTEQNSSGYSQVSGSYGLLYPDVGIVVLNAKALVLPMFTGDPNDGGEFRGGIDLPLNFSISPPTFTNRKLNTNYLFNTILQSVVTDPSLTFKLQSEETLSSNYVFIRARNSDFNYSTNPSFISGSTGDLINELLIDQPRTYITTVGMYNDNNELLAVAKLSRPLQKDFSKESLIRVRLDF